MFDTAAATRIPRSRLYLVGQRSQEQNDMPMHIYLSWVIYIPKWVNGAAILWPQKVPQDFFMISQLFPSFRSKVIGAK